MGKNKDYSKGIEAFFKSLNDDRYYNEDDNNETAKTAIMERFCRAWDKGEGPLVKKAEDGVKGSLDYEDDIDIWRDGVLGSKMINEKSNIYYHPQHPPTHDNCRCSDLASGIFGHREVGKSNKRLSPVAEYYRQLAGGIPSFSGQGVDEEKPPRVDPLVRAKLNESIFVYYRNGGRIKSRSGRGDLFEEELFSEIEAHLDYIEDDSDFDAYNLTEFYESFILALETGIESIQLGDWTWRVVPAATDPMVRVENIKVLSLKEEKERAFKNKWSKEDLIKLAEEEFSKGFFFSVKVGMNDYNIYNKYYWESFLNDCEFDSYRNVIKEKFFDFICTDIEGEAVQLTKSVFISRWRK